MRRLAAHNRCVGSHYTVSFVVLVEVLVHFVDRDRFHVWMVESRLQLYTSQTAIIAGGSLGFWLG